MAFPVCFLCRINRPSKFSVQLISSLPVINKQHVSNVLADEFTLTDMELSGSINAILKVKSFGRLFRVKTYCLEHNTLIKFPILCISHYNEIPKRFNEVM